MKKRNLSRHAANANNGKSAQPHANAHSHVTRESSGPAALNLYNPVLKASDWSANNVNNHTITHRSSLQNNNPHSLTNRGGPGATPAHGGLHMQKSNNHSHSPSNCANRARSREAASRGESLSNPQTPEPSYRQGNTNNIKQMATTGATGTPRIDNKTKREGGSGFDQLSGFLLRSHVISVISALCDDGRISAEERDCAGRLEGGAGRALDIAYGTFIATRDTEAFAASVRHLAACGGGEGEGCNAVEEKLQSPRLSA
uniref:Uncharacterized protein n=1 Tax=Chromera velia CCMP2878 TaxID=1169474 RepID=A0A0G4G1S6_9ALVE|eukprot:Cvel_19815.t1-p1 / transcript=Cvel_19815.t1 / gene=Cvel_19815 / organism=Chromera_velia_CCMP2878 / gene_product=hypothetical protein / transcript_product=hypothetical protein / location=Cvel_scaffold1734:22866-25167(+) / protein_length=257 / sequence_SO=supercontig / SO=protein_coding / is_pseudo=false